MHLPMGMRFACLRPRCAAQRRRAVDGVETTHHMFTYAPWSPTQVVASTIFPVILPSPLPNVTEGGR